MMTVNIWSDWMVLNDFVTRRRKDPFEKMSLDILKNFSFNFPYEIDMYDLCDAYGMRVVPSLFPGDVNYAVSGKKGRRGVIHLCVVEESRIVRETLAHEFSHLYLHQMNQLLSSNVVTDKMEKQAFKLAANILMPTKDLLNIEVYPDSNTTAFVASNIAEYFGVTTEFAYKRLNYFNENYKLHKQEPFKRIDEDERVYNTLFKNMYQSRDTIVMEKSAITYKRRTNEQVGNVAHSNKLVIYIDSNTENLVELN